MAGYPYHEPVLLREVVDCLITDPSGVYVDGSVGGGGHAEAICKRLTGGGVLVCCDADRDAIECAEERLRGFRERLSFVQANFSELEARLTSLIPGSVNGIARLTADMELLAGDLVRERTRYAMRSHLGFRLGRGASAGELQDWLALPASYNPRTHEFASELQRRIPAESTDRDARLVRAVLDHFREGGYEYTLSPPRLGRHSVDEFLFDTKRGYCEHYSSAFVIMMRALGVPARVVTG